MFTHKALRGIYSHCQIFVRIPINFIHSCGIKTHSHQIFARLNAQKYVLRENVYVYGICDTSEKVYGIGSYFLF